MSRAPLALLVSSILLAITTNARSQALLFTTHWNIKGAADASKSVILDYSRPAGGNLVVTINHDLMDQFTKVGLASILPAIVVPASSLPTSGSIVLGSIKFNKKNRWFKPITSSGRLLFKVFDSDAGYNQIATIPAAIQGTLLPTFEGWSISVEASGGKKGASLGINGTIEATVNVDPQIGFSVKDLSTGSNSVGVFSPGSGSADFSPPGGASVISLGTYTINSDAEEGDVDSHKYAIKVFNPSDEEDSQQRESSFSVKVTDHDVPQGDETLVPEGHSWLLFVFGITPVILLGGIRLRKQGRASF